MCSVVNVQYSRIEVRSVSLTKYIQTSMWTGWSCQSTIATCKNGFATLKEQQNVSQTALKVPAFFFTNLKVLAVWEAEGSITVLQAQTKDQCLQLYMTSQRGGTMLAILGYRPVTCRSFFHKGVVQSCVWVIKTTVEPKGGRGEGWVFGRQFSLAQT